MATSGLLEVFSEPFVLRALAAAAVSGYLLPLVGGFIVPRRLSLLGDSSSHFAFAAIAVGALFGVSGIFLAYVFVVVGIFVVLRLVRVLGVSGDQALAVVLAFGAALASLAISRGARISLGSVLFGSLLAVDELDLLAGALVTVLASVFVYRNFGGVLLYTLSDELARSRGVNTGLYEFLLAVVAGLAVAVSVRVAGVLLVTAVMVVPVMTASLLSTSFKKFLGLAVLFGELGLILGVLLSLTLEMAPGASSVFVLLGILGVSAALHRAGLRI
jgi:zinc transport system permease protein